MLNHSSNINSHNLKKNLDRHYCSLCITFRWNYILLLTCLISALPTDNTFYFTQA